MNKQTKPVKNKLPNCKYTPKQFAQRVDYFVRRLDNLQNSGKRIEFNLMVESALVTNTMACGCVAGLFSISMKDPQYYLVSKQMLFKYFGYNPVLLLENTDLEFLTFSGFLHDLELSNCWPYISKHALSSPEAYGEIANHKVTLQLVLDTWRQFAENIRKTPESNFFSQQLELTSGKE